MYANYFSKSCEETKSPYEANSPAKGGQQPRSRGLTAQKGLTAHAKGLMAQKVGGQRPRPLPLSLSLSLSFSGALSWVGLWPHFLYHFITFFLTIFFPKQTFHNVARSIPFAKKYLGGFAPIV